MKLISLKVKDVGVIRGEVEIPAFDTSLTVLHGPNETGKSTLFRALQAALFERHNAGHGSIRSLETWNTNNAPEVWITLECGGIRYDIHKRFLDKASSRLIVHGTPRCEFQGDEADERIRDLMSSETPGKQGAKPEQKGVWPLLWLDQGSAGENPAGSMHVGAQGRLREALEGIVGDVIGGPQGEPLLAAAIEERNRYYTRQRLTETGALAKAREQAQEAQRELTERQRRLEGSRALADRLQSVSENLVTEEKRLHTARKHRETAREVLNKLRELEQSVGQAANTRDVAKGNWEKARENLERRKQAIEDHSNRRKAIADGEQTLAVLVAQAKDAEASLATLRDVLQKADDALKNAERRHRQLLEDRELLRLQADLQEKTARLEKGKALEKQIRQLEERLVKQLVTDEQVEDLADRDKEIAKARAALEAAAARLTVTPERNLQLSIDDGPAAEYKADQSETITVDEPRKVAILGVATVRVEPGGKGLKKRREKLAELQNQQHEALLELGVKDLAEARDRAKERARLEGERTKLDAELWSRVPEGIEDLQVETRRLRNKEQGILADRDPSLGQPNADGIDRQIADAETALNQARDAAADARRSYDAKQADAGRMREKLNGEQGQLDIARKELARVDDALKTERATVGSDEQLEAAVPAAFQEYQNKNGEAEALCRQLEACDPEVIRDEANRTDQVATQLEQELHNLSQEKAQLVGEVRQAGTRAFYEELDEAESASEQAGILLRSVERQARAALRLSETLGAAKAEAQERFIQPLKDEIAPLLSVLLPDCDVTIDENLNLEGMVRRNTSEPFDALSGGMREQLAVLVRLAFASILAGDKDVVPVILDDSLVWTDDDRFKRMVAVLRRASHGLQIIILTCHGDRYIDLGAGKRIDFEALRQDARRPN